MSTRSKKLDMSISTESKYSETSYDQTGGWLWSNVSGSESELISQLILKAFNERKINEGLYIFQNVLNNPKIEINYSIGDDEGRTILHYLVLYSSCYPEIKSLFMSILGSDKVRKSINVKDSQGNTIAHYAMYLEMNDMIGELEKQGADLSVRNKEGLYISTKETVPVNTQTQTQTQPQSQSDIFMKADLVSNLSEGSEAGELDQRIKKMVERYLAQRKPESDSTIGFDRNAITDTNIPRLTVISVTSSDKMPDDLEKGNLASQNMPYDSDRFVDAVMRALQSGKKEKLPTSRPSVPTSVPVSNVPVSNVQPEMMMEGGSRCRKSSSSSMTGRRKIVTYSEMSGGVSESSELSSDDVREMGKLARDIELARDTDNKASEAHNRAVDRIKEYLRKKHGKRMSDDEIDLMARAYKSLIYDAVKVLVMSNLDKALETEKRAGDDDLLEKFSEFDVESRMKDIKKNREAKEEERRKRKEEQKKFPELSSESEEMKPKRGKRKEEQESSESGEVKPKRGRKAEKS